MSVHNILLKRYCSRKRCAQKDCNVEKSLPKENCIYFRFLVRYVSWISGNGGERMADEDNSTCTMVPQNTPDGSTVQYTFSVMGGCKVNNRVGLKVTMDRMIDCNILRNVIFTEKESENCETTKVHLVPCCVTESSVIMNQSVCVLSCTCHRQVNQCLVHIYYGRNPHVPEVKICDI